MGSVAKFYSGKNVLVTGTTGFLGTALVEKLLRSFPQINKIYSMVRTGKFDSIEERAKTYFDREAFHTGRYSHSKVKWIECDFEKPGLNLAKDDATSIMENINVIIHCASLVHFMAPLRQAAAVNVTGTQTLLEIAKNCKNLESFVYVSSAYSNALKHGDIIDETLGPYKADRHEIFEKLKNYDDATVKVVNKDWIEGWGNCYVLTKNATESLVHDYGNFFPVGIYRPGLVVHAFAEPYPYWKQSSVGILKVLACLRQGIRIPCSDSAPMNIVPVDICANGLIASAFDVSKDSGKFYNCTNSENIVSAKEGFNYVLEGIRHKGIDLLDVQDAKTRYGKEIKDIEKLAASTKHILHSDFTWLNRNFENLWQTLDSADKDVLFFDIDAINWKEFLNNMFKSTRETKCHK